MVEKVRRINEKNRNRGPGPGCRPASALDPAATAKYLSPFAFPDLFGHIAPKLARIFHMVQKIWPSHNAS